MEVNNHLKDILSLNGRGLLNKINKDKDIINEIMSLTSFLPQEYPLGSRIYCIKNNLKEIPSCECGSPLIYRSGRFTKTCGKKECIFKENKKNLLKKYGVDHIFKDRERMKKSYLEKYGVDNPQKSEKIKNKTKQTNLKRYGVENPFQNEEIKNKIKGTNKKRYGTDWYISSNEYKQKIKDSFQQKREKQFNELLGGNNYTFKDGQTIIYKCPKCHKESELNIGFLKLRIYRYDVNICTHCNPIYVRNSGKEIEIYDWIESLNFKVEKNFRLKNNKEIDIYIPTKNLGIEYNGLYWHSELFRDKNYHLNKLEQANEEGIHLLFVWEDDWIYKKDIIKSIIKNKLGLGNKIYARKTEVKEIKIGIKDFLNTNHLQGFIPAAIKLGLYLENELVSCMTFGKRKNNYDIGEDIISYANTDISEGTLYETLGFKLEGRTSIGYWWGKGNQKFNREKFQKHKLIKEGNNPNLTEEEIMHKNGFFKIYNTGNLKYVYD